ncbi:hypothetical protein Godav_015623 [Gossypium davidsonii]|uniref:Uncharacterized protein n=1 Tax=Gossypium davidsonii TaxID=34287 RepID=A0A7J8RP83_GOSDV|nr:hypothetical protein [Gossypium davidsonii]
MKRRIMLFKFKKILEQKEESNFFNWWGVFLQQV